MRRALAAAALILAMAGAASAQSALTLSLATATPGGGFPVYGAAFAAALAEADPSLTIATRNTAGSTENVPLLERGAVDLALVQGDVAQGVLARGTELRIVTAMYATAGLFVVRADSPARSMRDLVGKPVAFGAKGSGLVLLARTVLDGIGLDADRDFQAIYLDRAGDGPAMVADGRAAALWGGGVGWPGFMAVGNAPGGARWIAPNAEEIARVRAKAPYLREIIVPAGTYPGQREPLTSVGTWSFVLARPGLPDDAVFRLAKALHRAEPALAQRLPQAAETTLKNTVAAAPRPELIHSGVRRYAREIGLAP